MSFEEIPLVTTQSYRPVKDDILPSTYWGSSVQGPTLRGGRGLEVSLLRVSEYDSSVESSLKVP